VQGESFNPLLDDPAAAGKLAVFPRWKNADSIRTDRYFYTEWRDKKRKVTARMLFDHYEDPAETANLAEDITHAQIVEKLHNQLATHIQSVEIN
jgi:arylsulfatase A-like enzyme